MAHIEGIIFPDSRRGMYSLVGGSGPLGNQEDITKEVAMTGDKKKRKEEKGRDRRREEIFVYEC